MKSWNKPTNEMVEKALASVKKETDRQYFFSRLENPLWIQPLAERGYFQSPPQAKKLPDGYIQFPAWPELQYLKNISSNAPDDVIRLVLQLPEVDNPRVYDDILDIALRLHGQQSAKLKPKMLEYASLDHQLLPHKFKDLIVHWTAENQYSAALELSKELIKFKPDPHSEVKQIRRKENPGNWSTILEPLPRFDQWNYQQILENGIQPLIDKAAYQVAVVLINATASMLRLSTHQEDLDAERNEDLSEIWCRRLDQPDPVHEDIKATLIHTLTFSCEKVYENSPESVEPLDETLRNQRWKVFKRLRQHLYAMNPSEQTLPWIREFIIEHEDYAKWEHHFEFQLMTRKACEHFGADLLNEEEKTAIFDSIRSGPSKDNFREWMGDQFTEEKFQQRQRYFHRSQLRPFACLLTGEYQSYFQELENELAKQTLSDEDYSPVGESGGGMVSYRSPRSPEDLAGLNDEDLLVYINEWQEEHYDENDDLVEINIRALADAFQTVFKDSIIHDKERLAFWMNKYNAEQIERPIYVKSIIQAIQQHVKEQNFEQLYLWFGFCEWVLQHPDAEHEEGVGPSEESREHPDWRSSRRAVQDFVETCLERDLNFPLSAQEALAKLLRTLCTQFDRRLDYDEPVLLNRDDQITEAINNTRSRALDTLTKFGFWVRGNDAEGTVTEVTSILDMRLKTDAEPPLTLPEYAILGMNFGNLRILNQTWAAEHKADFFPQDDLPVWTAAFGSYLRFNRPASQTFEILKQEFAFALERLTDLAANEDRRMELIDKLGQHLFTYYLWSVYPLMGEDSLLEKFYEKTTGDYQRHASLFDYVGRILRNSGTHLDKGLEERIVAFFDWRLEAKEPIELAEFTFWLQAKCLAPDWRLDAYSKILEISHAKDVGISIELDSLNDMLEDHTAKVVECLAKITDAVNQGKIIFIQTEKVKPILVAGLRSLDEGVRENAERARENLLKGGRFDILDIEQ